MFFLWYSLAHVIAVCDETFLDVFSHFVVNYVYADAYFLDR
jgi:hypothetical protein